MDKPSLIPTAAVARLGHIEAEPVRWLWPGRVPMGALTLITGDPGLGKSMLVLDIIARVTSARGWPDGQQGMKEPHDVLFIGGEDDLATTVRPRLEAAGGDPERVLALQGINNSMTGESEPFHLRRHQASLKRAVETSSAVLVVIDPLWAHLPGSGSPQEIRSVMAGIGYMAQMYNVAFLAVTHLNKQTSIRAMYRSAGHMALIAATRCAHLVAREPDAEREGDAAAASRRVMLPVKNNLCAPRPGLSFVVGENRIDWETGLKVKSTADWALAESGGSRHRRAMDLQQAEGFLGELLAGGALASRDVFKAVEARGWNRTLVRLAAQRIGVRFRKDGNDGAWMWEMAGEPVMAQAADPVQCTTLV